MKSRFNQFLSGISNSAETPCAYFKDRQSRVRAFICEETFPPEMFEMLLNKGFRRCGSYFYQQTCKSCQLCLSYRLPLDRFRLSTSQKKVLRKNKNLRATTRTPQPDAVKEFIYLRYQYAQHHAKPAFESAEFEEFNASKVLAVMYEQMYTNSEGSVELEIFDDNKLIAFGIIDRDNHSTSAVYSAYDPEYYKNSLGTFYILKAIEWAQKNNFSYLHLGYFIPGHQKMHYKSNFQPAEILHPVERKWVDAKQFIDVEVAKLTEQVPKI